MKTNQIINWLTISLAFLGVLFKMIHKPEADLLIMLTLLTLIISTVLSFRNNKQNGMGDILNYSITLILLLLTTANAFIIFPWPGSYTFQIIRSLVFLMLPVIMLIANKENRVPNSFWLIFLVNTMLVISMMQIKVYS